MRILYLAWDEYAWRASLVNELRKSPNIIHTAYLHNSLNKYLFAIETLYKSLKCDVLLADYASDMGFGATRLRFLHRKPVVVYARGGDVDYHDPGFKKNINFNQIQFSIKNADLVLCVSEYVRRCILDLWPHAKGKLRLVYNGVDLTRFHPVQHPAGVKLIAVGTLVKRKGFDVVIRAMELVAKTYPTVHLSIIGIDPLGLGNQLKQMVQELGLERNITFLGGISDAEVTRLFAESDLFVHAPWHEPFGVVNLEAMASGLPVIATNVGGIPEIVPEEFLVPAGDFQALAQRICDVLGWSEEKRRRIGMQNITIVRKRFDINRQATGVLSAMQEALRSHLIK